MKTEAYPAGVPGRALKKLDAIQGDIEAARIAGVRYSCFRAKRAAERAEEFAAVGAAAAEMGFDEYARTWLANRAVTKPLKPRTVAENLRLLEKEIFPLLRAEHSRQDHG